MDTLPLEHNFNSSPANADAFTLFLYYFLLLACCSFAVVRASRRPLQTLSNAGLAVLLEEAWYTLPSPSISASLSANRRRCILFSVLIVSLFLLRSRYSAPPAHFCPPPAREGCLHGRLPLGVALLVLTRFPTAERAPPPPPPPLAHRHSARTHAFADTPTNCRFFAFVSHPPRLPPPCAGRPSRASTSSRVVDGYRWLRYSRQSFRPPEPLQCHTRPLMATRTRRHSPNTPSPEPRRHPETRCTMGSIQVGRDTEGHRRQ
jgi:hypothetical protein